MKLRNLLHPWNYLEHELPLRRDEEARQLRIEANRRGEPCPECAIYHDDDRPEIQAARAAYAARVIVDEYEDTPGAPEQTT